MGGQVQLLFHQFDLVHSTGRTVATEASSDVFFFAELQAGDLGKAVGTSGDIIGKTKRDEIKPSIDTAAKIADALNVTIDFLVKDGEYQNIDNDALKRLKLLEKLNPKDKDHIYALMDAFFAKYKMDSLLQH